FMWRQFYNMTRLGAQAIYISMFDEYNEGNQIAKTAETLNTVPTNSGMLALDEDGTPCSSDYYLRLTSDGGKMLKGQIPLTPIRPTQPTLGGGDPNLALGKATSESGHAQVFGSANTVDGNANTYWESVNNAFPQWIQVDLGALVTVGRVVLKLPPSSSWGTRVQTLSVAAGGSVPLPTIVGSMGYTFDPATGNAVTISFASTTARYLRLNFTGNTGWPAAQLGEFEVYGPSGGGGGDTQPPTAPGNLAVTAKTATSVTLTWTASTDNVAVTGYQVHRGDTIVNATGTTTTITGLTPATAYTFTVTARDAAGNNSPASNAVSVTTDTAPNTNLALGKATSESGHVQAFGSANTVDGNANTYWESVNNAFPQWIQVDLGSVMTVGRVVLKLPPSSSWGARVQTLSVAGGGSVPLPTIVGPVGYRFDPATGNAVTISFASTPMRYVRLNFTGNTGWPAAQLSEFEVYGS
ncbi:galactose-binding domain-containing protein, partial [Sphaerisporangium corydalis]